MLSHRAAARIWEISDRAESEIDVTVGRPIRSRPGLRVHRASLDRRDLRTRDGLLVTAPERTILDLATSTTRDELALALNEARGKRIVRERYLLSRLDRFPRRRGTRALRALLAAERGPLVTRSEAERRMLELIRRAGLPRPAVNSRIAGYEVDLLWPDHGLVLEVDGYAFHSRPADFERDRRREQDLAAAGLRVSRVTWLQIVDEPAAVVARLAGALARVL